MIRFTAFVLSTTICVAALADEEEKKLETMFNKAIELFNNEDYVTACVLFRRVYQKRPMASYMYNIGRCEYEKKRYDLAYEAFVFYLDNAKKNKDESFGTIANEKVEVLKTRIAFLNVDTSDVYNVFVDDEMRASTPLKKPIPVLVGKRHVVIKKDKEVILDKNVLSTNEERQTLKIITPVKSKDAITPETPPYLEPVSPTPSKSPLKGVGIGLAGLGGAMMISGSITGALTLSKAGKLEDSCPDKEQNCDSKRVHDKGKTLSVITNVFLSAGAIALVAGTIMTILGSKKNRTESVRILPSTLGELGHGLVVEGIF